MYEEGISIAEQLPNVKFEKKKKKILNKSSYS